MEAPGATWRPPRICDDYRSEFKLCTSLRSRFHQYYAHGAVQSCHQWTEDYETCKAWEKLRATDAKEALQRSERTRVEEQRNFSPVWKMRTAPPRDWHTPLNQDKPLPETGTHP